MSSSSNNARLGIEVDANGAIRSINEFKQSIKQADTSITSLNKQLYNNNANIRSDAFEKIKNQLQTQAEYYVKLNDAITGNTKAYKLYNTEIEKLVFSHRATKEQISELVKIQDSYANAVNDTLDAEKRSAQQKEIQILLTQKLVDEENKYLNKLQEQAEIDKKNATALEKTAYQNSWQWADKLAKQQKEILENQASELIQQGKINEAYQIKLQLLKEEAQVAINNEKNKYEWGQANATDEIQAQIYYANEQIKLDKERKKAIEEYTAAQAKANSSTMTFGRKMLEIGKNILVFQTAIALFRKTLTAIKTTITESVKVAAEAEQIYSKLSTVFDGFSSSANKAAEELAKALGVAKSTASSSLSTIGDLLQAQGMSVAESLTTATKWAEQLQDIINFKDLSYSLEEFADVFMSGAAGNLRNFRTFGSIVKESAVQAKLASQGLDKLTGSELELAKMTSRAEIALEQQANAIGATEREWGTLLSVNRRLTEEQKKFNENLGNVMLPFVKDIKENWTETLKSINESIEAALKLKEIREGRKNSSNLPKASQAESIAQKQTRLFTFERKYGTDARKVVENEDNATYVKFLKRQYATQFKITTQEIQDWSNAWGKSINDTVTILQYAGASFSDGTLKILENINKVAEAEAVRAKELENKNSSLSSALDKYDSVIESMLAIAGVRFEQSPIQFGSQDYQTAIDQQIIESSKEAVSSIMNATAESVGKSFESYIEEFGTADLLDIQIQSMRSLLEIQWNQFNSDGNLTDEENATLKDTIKQYQDLQTQLEEYNAEQDALVQAEKDRIKAEEDLIKAAEEEAKARLEWIKQFKESINPLQQYFSAYSQGKENLGGVIQQSKIGQELGLSAGASGVLGGVISVLAEILKQTEAFNELSNLVTNYIVPVFDALFKPLMPAIQNIGQALQELVYTFMMPLFPAIKIIAEVVVLLMTPVRIVAAVIKNIFTAVHNVIELLKHPANASKRDMWEYDSLKEIWGEQIALLKKIHNTTFEIEKNTEDIDTGAYDEMYRRGLLTLSEYNSLVSDAYGKPWDKVNTFANGSFQNGSGGTTVVHYGAITIQIDGTNLSAKEIADELERRSIPGNQTYA